MWPYPLTHSGTPLTRGQMDRLALTLPSQALAGAAQETPQLGQWEGQDIPLVRPPSCIVKRGIPTSRRYLRTYLPTFPFGRLLLPFHERLAHFASPVVVAPIVLSGSIAPFFLVARTTLRSLGVLLHKVVECQNSTRGNPLLPAL